MVVELLAGALTGGSFVFDEGDWGTFYMAFSPDLLVGTDKFKNNSSELIRKVKSGKKQEGKEIHIPGYDTETKMQKIMDSGELEIEEKLVNQLKERLNT